MPDANPKAFANVVGAFNVGLSKGQAPAETAANPTNEIDTFSLLQVLQSLSDEGGGMPFSAFAKRLPGDDFTALSATVRLMKDGWVEFVGDISENSDVRLTPKGSDMLATLHNSIAAS